MQMIVEDGNIVSVKGLEVGREILDLRHPIPIEEHDNLEKTVKYLFEHFNLNVSADEWTEEELIMFMKERTEKQRTFLRVLSESSDDMVYMNDLINGMEELGFNFNIGNILKGKVLAGVTSGLTRAFKKWKKERFYTDGEADIPDDRCNKDWQVFWKMKPRYRKMIKKYFKKVAQS